MRKFIVHSEHTWSISSNQICSSTSSHSFQKNQPRNLYSLASALLVSPKTSSLPRNFLFLISKYLADFLLPKLSPTLLHNSLQNIPFHVSFAYSPEKNTPLAHSSILVGQNFLKVVKMWSKIPLTDRPKMRVYKIIFIFTHLKIF